MNQQNVNIKTKSNDLNKFHPDEKLVKWKFQQYCEENDFIHVITFGMKDR